MGRPCGFRSGEVCDVCVGVERVWRWWAGVGRGADVVMVVGEVLRFKCLVKSRYR